GTQDPVRLEHGGARISDPAVRPADQDETIKAEPIERFFDPSTECGPGRHMSDDVVHDGVDTEVTPESLDEIPRVHVAEERLSLMVLLEDLGQVEPVQAARGTDRVAHPIHEVGDSLLPRPPRERADL